MDPFHSSVVFMFMCNILFRSAVVLETVKQQHFSVIQWHGNRTQIAVY